MFNPWLGKIPWRRKWQPTPAFLSGKSHGQRGLVDHSSRGRKESDTTWRLNHHKGKNRRVSFGTRWGPSSRISAELLSLH